MNLQRHVTSALQLATKFRVPFPHFFVENVFPAGFYEELMILLAQKKDFHAEKFANREFADEVGIPALDFMREKGFLKDMFHLFLGDAAARFAGTTAKLGYDLRLIRDSQNYKIGPHTDTPSKVLSLLFYLPDDETYRECGTSVFVPNNPDFRCPGGPHHPFEGFREVWRAPFLPNSCFGFWKTNNSFHGVLPLPVQFRRDVLLYNIYAE